MGSYFNTFCNHDKLYENIVVERIQLHLLCYSNKDEKYLKMAKYTSIASSY